MARPRKFSDDQLLDRVAVPLEDSGAGWTLAGAADAAGLHPATLVKRFGSRQGLLLALSRRWVAGIPGVPTTSDAYGELMAWTQSLTPGQASTGQILARVDMLVEDLRDPELRALLHEGWQRQLGYLAALIDRSRRDGQLRGDVPAETLAALVLDLTQGGLLRMAASPDPTAVDPARSVGTLLKSWS